MKSGNEMPFQVAQPVRRVAALQPINQFAQPFHSFARPDLDACCTLWCFGRLKHTMREVQFFDASCRFALLGLIVLGAVLQLVRRRMRRARPIRAGRLVVVTGASGGIGREIAIVAARRGAALLLTGRNVEALGTTADLCKQAGAAHVSIEACDLMLDQDRRRLIECVRSAPCALECVVLNAGMGGITAFDGSDTSMKITRDLMELNYFANVDLVRRLLADITAANSRLLVISSLSGVLAVPMRAQYCASKFALQAFFNSLRMQLRAADVGITTVCPSYVATDFHHKVMSVAGVAPARKGKFLSAAACAERAIRGLEAGEHEVVLSLDGWLAYHVRPWIPEIVDAFVARVAQKSIR